MAGNDFSKFTRIETTERKKKYVELARRLKDCVGTYSSTPRMEYIRKIANIISFH